VVNLLIRRCARFLVFAACAVSAAAYADGPDLCAGFSNVIVRDADASNTTVFTSSDGTIAGPNDVIVIRFRTGSIPNPNQFGNIAAAEFNSQPSARTAALSNAICDFSSVLGSGAVSNGNTVTVSFSVGSNTSGIYPQLQLNTVYYFNIKQQPGSTCSSQGNCTMYAQVHAPPGLSLASLPAVANVAVSSGSGQSAQVATAFAQPLVALVTDTDGNPVPNAAVIWAAPTATASASFTFPLGTTTDYRGLATANATANGNSGTYTVTPQVAGLGANFTLTNTGAPSVCDGNDATIGALVEQYYETILRRPSDPTGKAFWISEADRLCGLGADPEETFFLLANVLFNSPEYLAFNRDDSDFVTDLYMTFFGRSPDGAGLGYWTGQLSSGLPRNIVMSSFLFSPEFAATMDGIFPGSTARAESYLVLNLYGGLFRRLADSPGYMHWVAQFQAAQCTPTPAASVQSQIAIMSSQFLTTPEYAALATTNSQYVQGLYYALLQRGGDLAGFDFWVAQLDNGALTRDQVLQQFLQGPEMQSQSAAIAAQGCAQ
jgi:hypothetical protein